jgi:hypothetical protein
MRQAMSALSELFWDLTGFHPVFYLTLSFTRTRSSLTVLSGGVKVGSDCKLESMGKCNKIIYLYNVVKVHAIIVLILFLNVIIVYFLQMLDINIYVNGNN